MATLSADESSLQPIVMSKPMALSTMGALISSGVSFVSSQSETCSGVPTPKPPSLSAATSCISVDTHTPAVLDKRSARRLGSVLVLVT